MKPGDLRRFKRDLTSIGVEPDVSGLTFLVLKTVEYGGSFTVDILIDGRVEEYWGYPWVKENSEVISEAR